MATISDILDYVRDVTDDVGDQPRMSDAVGLRYAKRALQRAWQVIVNNNLPIGVSTQAYTTTADQQNEDLPSDFQKHIGLQRDSTGKMLRYINVEQWARLYRAGESECTIWTILDDDIYLASTPSAAIDLTLFYWPTLDLSAYSVNTSMPWGGKLDEPIKNYLTLLALNTDEYNLDQDMAFLQEMENQIVTGLAPLEIGSLHGPVPEY